MKESEHVVMIECLIVSLMFGFAGVFIRTLSSLGFTPIQITVFRFGLSAVILIIAALCIDRSYLVVHKRDIWLFIVFGFVNVVSNSLFSYSISTIPLGLATVLIMTAPFYVIVLSLLLFKERITANKVIAVLIGILGCLFVAGLFTDGTGNLELMGVLAGVFSGIAYGIILIGGKFFGERGYRPETAVIYMSLFAGLIGLAICDLPDFTETVLSSGLSWILPSLGYALLITVIPFVVLYRAQRHISPGLVSVIGTSEVIGSAVVGVLVYNETLDIYQAIGIAAILLSMVIMDLAICRNIKSGYREMSSKFWKIFDRKPEQ